MREPQMDNSSQRTEDDEIKEDSTESPPENAGEPQTDSMEEELEAERQRSAEHLDQAQRARAELMNYRRRTEEELAQMQKRAGERIIAKMLPAIDDLDRAIDSMSDEERASSWGEGILLVQRKLWSTLESEGVAPIPALGHPFDPTVHEAISMQGGANGATTVVQEYQRGFMLGDRVLRPAMVVVGSADDAPAPTQEQLAHEPNADSNDEHDS